MTKWAFDLSEDLGLPVLVRTVTRVSHARGNVLLGDLPHVGKKPLFDTSKRCSSAGTATKPTWRRGSSIVKNEMVTKATHTVALKSPIRALPAPGHK